MSGRYERVNAHDDDAASDNDTQPKTHRTTTPNSPPPSFRSRASSLTPRNGVNQDLADAFDDDEASDDEADDRQRLVRGNTTPSSSSANEIFTPQTSDAEGHSTRAPGATPSGSRPRVMGGGIGTDGVFANMSARPERVDSENEKEEQPPTYEQAAADAAPPYWETTILAPGYGGIDDVFIEGMPVGSVFSFIWNGMIAASIQVVGFLLTYLLHSTHAAKNGSRAGLGINLIQFGFDLKYAARNAGEGTSVTNDGYASPNDPNSHDFSGNDGSDDGGNMTMTSGEWFAYFLMIIGWFILIKAVAEYVKVRRHEQLVLQSPDRGLGVPIIAEGENSERVV